MERDCESELSKLNIEQNACIYHFGASVIRGQRSNILRLRIIIVLPLREPIIDQPNGQQVQVGDADTELYTTQ